MKKSIIITLTACFLMAACGGRVAQPVMLQTSLDENLSCTHLSGEYDNNTKRLVELVGEREGKAAKNIGTALFVNPIFLDLSQSQKQEVAALDARNERLIMLGSLRECKFVDILTEEPVTP